MFIEHILYNYNSRHLEYLYVAQIANDRSAMGFQIATSWTIYVFACRVYATLPTSLIAQYTVPYVRNSTSLEPDQHSLHMLPICLFPSRVCGKIIYQPNACGASQCVFATTTTVIMLSPYIFMCSPHLRVLDGKQFSIYATLSALLNHHII